MDDYCSQVMTLLPFHTIGYVIDALVQFFLMFYVLWQVPVGHLVFMIHGIGQRLEKANLVDDVVDFRRVTTSLAERFLTPYQRSTQRVLFIPCQVRSHARRRMNGVLQN